jgi:hypothetical protein
MTLSPLLLVKWTVNGDNLFIYYLFLVFTPTLGGYKCHFSDLKWGQKWEKNVSLH